MEDWFEQPRILDVAALKSKIVFSSSMAFLVFYITCPDEKAAQNIAQHLLEGRLVACANTFPVKSAYWWQGAMQCDGEWVCIAKTAQNREVEVETAVLKAHPYDLPCIMRFEARANAAYEQWIENETVG